MLSLNEVLKIFKISDYTKIQQLKSNKTLIFHREIQEIFFKNLKYT
jgi:hypothetical protein